ncbi:YMGG-like glycine zipper-containing protein [Telmatospirillum siberiense]|uniref:YMGG-like glycine zipper-containing protein n=1 Tax=Telmatospirillum siberiense TaxID=382514 RepID=UPI001F538AB9|nr:YMGG-like glycine zipper-containing protein [Telmatospirillum siberiense]
MRSCRDVLVVLSGLVLLAGCASTPRGPTIQVMPAPNKPFPVFQEDVAICKDYASQQIAGQSDSVNERALGGALLGTALGAGLGAAVDGGRGAGVGAAAGALLGTGIGASSSDHSQGGIQRQYDTAFAQCMYSKGNQVPGFRPISAPPPPSVTAPPPVVATPPVGTPPPPNAVPAPANLPPPSNP